MRPAPSTPVQMSLSWVSLCNTCIPHYFTGPGTAPLGITHEFVNGADLVVHWLPPTVPNGRIVVRYAYIIGSRGLLQAYRIYYTSVENVDRPLSQWESISVDGDANTVCVVTIESESVEFEGDNSETARCACLSCTSDLETWSWHFQQTKSSNAKRSV